MAENRFEPLNDLERLLVEAATDPEARPAFTRALMEAQLFAVSGEPGPIGQRVAGEGETVSLVMVPLQDGGQATAVFTAAERVGQIYGPEAHYIAIRGSDLLAMVSANPLLLNPGLAYGVLWSPADIAAMLGRPVERVVARGTQFMLGHPAEVPENLVLRLTEHLHPEAGVRAAWLALAHWPDSGEQAWYLDVRSDLPHERLRELLGRALDGADLAGRMLDMRIQPPGGGAGAGITIVEPR